MAENQNQPRKFDAVIGGETSSLNYGVVLGGIEGVKKRLDSDDYKVKIAALEDALKYGDKGIDLIIEALYNNDSKMHERAICLLRQAGEKGKQELLYYDPWLWFTTFKCWNSNYNFSSYDNISDTIDVAYQVENKNLLTRLIKDSQSKYLQSIKCEFYYKDKNIKNIFEDCVNLLVNSSNSLPSLRALLIGDLSINWNEKYRQSRVNVSNIYPLLKAYPNLELLHIRGRMIEGDILKSNLQLLQIRNPNDNSLVPINQSLKNDFLKTLIIDADGISDKNLAKLCHLNLPSLEYLEIWLNRSDLQEINLDSIAPVLSGKSCPNLLYLAVRQSRNTSELAKAVVNSTIIKNLKVLELTDGNMSAGGADYLLKSSAVNRLHTLNVSGNRLNTSTIERLEKLNCRVINQSYRYYSVWE